MLIFILYNLNKYYFCIFCRHLYSLTERKDKNFTMHYNHTLAAEIDSITNKGHYEEKPQSNWSSGSWYTINILLISHCYEFQDYTLEKYFNLYVSGFHIKFNIHSIQFFIFISVFTSRKPITTDIFVYIRLINFRNYVL